MTVRPSVATQKGGEMKFNFVYDYQNRYAVNMIDVESLAKGLESWQGHKNVGLDHLLLDIDDGPFIIFRDADRLAEEKIAWILCDGYEESEANFKRNHAKLAAFYWAEAEKIAMQMDQAPAHSGVDKGPSRL